MAPALHPIPRETRSLLWPQLQLLYDHVQKRFSHQPDHPLSGRRLELPPACIPRCQQWLRGKDPLPEA